jgi:hypothetical protein
MTFQICRTLLQSQKMYTLFQTILQTLKNLKYFLGPTNIMQVLEAVSPS